ncbi:hypothetical protein PVAG01_04819 [Phlyctema vagabunda]|uniref:Uncharacterized protein n=1 Tax=Phlyctema vagabunda TaxID=108571 RepID=A0ABR4PIB2_9HELO
MADNNTAKYSHNPQLLPPLPLKQAISNPLFTARAPEEPIVADPRRLSGQRVGAILVVKRTPTARVNFSQKHHHINYSIHEVGDHVKVFKFHGSSDVEVENLRTGKISMIRWECFFPLAVLERCSCADKLALQNNKLSAFPLPPSSTATSPDAVEPETKYKIADPTTIEGQSPGAILVIKQKPIGTTLMKDCAIEVGDHIEIIHGIPQDAALVKAKNFRTGAIGLVLWEAVFPVTRRKVCDCNQVQRRCWCIYTDFSHSMMYNKSPART